jgi:ABC-2 type transport system ATP-binding protein
MIALRNLTFSYSPKKTIFQNLTLTLSPGTLYGLLGKNGAGKSSLLRLIGGMLFPQAGQLQVAGFEPAQRQAAFLQMIYLIPEEIYLPGVSLQRYINTLAPFYPYFNQGQFHHYLTDFEVPQDQKLTALSYGQKKKLVISFALATNTPILLMDEPTNGLDIPSKRQFRKLIASAIAPDRLILISTHQVKDLDNLIDAVIVVDESEILLNHSLAQIAQRLRFDNVSALEEADCLLYAEPSLRGQAVVLENPTQADSKVDLERLFNTVLANRERIKALFHPSR